MRSIPASRLTLLLVVCAIAACGRGRTAGDTAATGQPASHSATQQGDAELTDVTNYRLTMEKVDRYLDVQRIVIKRFVAMSPAERQAVKEVANGIGNASGSIDEMADRIGKHPVLSVAVRQAGLSPREYALITMSMLQSSMAMSVLAMRPNDNADSLAREMQANPQNIAFMREHQAEITQKSEALNAEAKRVGADE